jgi:hypothetical protein
MNGHHEITRRGDPAGRQTKQGAGRRISGACRARVKFGQRLLPFCTALCILAPAKLWALSDMAPPSATTFAYRVSHPVTPLPDTVIEKIADAENGADAAFEEDMTRETDVKTPRRLSRPDLCRTLASVAHANELPVPFFSNLIWHESSFNTGTISRAGAQGIAQFMPRTAAMYDLINPFEPIHAINVAGKFLKELHQQFGNLGLAAAAYNAGPKRVADWIAGRGGLPTETQRYVMRITGRPAEYWLQGKAQTGPEALLMPAKAPCIEVAVEVEAQVQVVRVARLVSELASATEQTRRVASGDSDTDTTPPKTPPAGKGQKVKLAKAEAKSTGNEKTSGKEKSSGKDKKSVKLETTKKDSSKSEATQSASAKSIDVSAARKSAKAEAKAETKAPATDAAKAKGEAKADAQSRTASKADKGNAKPEPEVKIAAKSDAKPEPQAESKPTSGDAAKDKAKDAAKTAPAEEAAASQDPPPRRRVARRARVEAYDRHTGVR